MKTAAGAFDKMKRSVVQGLDWLYREKITGYLVDRGSIRILHHLEVVERRRGSNRVKRGGSWNNNARNCRSANRNNNSPGNRNNNLGFRLARPPHRPTVWIQGSASSAPVVTRVLVPRPGTGTKSDAGRSVTAGRALF